MSRERNAKADLDLCAAATPGPWTATKIDDIAGGDLYAGDDKTVAGIIESLTEARVISEAYFIESLRTEEEANANGRFIAACPEMVPYWIRRAQKLEAALTRKIDECRERTFVMSWDRRTKCEDCGSGGACYAYKALYGGEEVSE